MATVPDTAVETSVWSPISREERDQVAQQFRSALAESDSLQHRLVELARAIREERDHVGE